MAVFVWPTKYYAQVILPGAAARANGGDEPINQVLLAPQQGADSEQDNAGGQHNGSNFNKVKSDLVPYMALFATFIASTALIVSAASGWWVSAFAQESDGSL